MDLDDSPRLPPGFLCASRNAGLKESEPDLSLFAADRVCSAAGLFTRNHFPGAPILLGRERLRTGRLQAVVANSKVSNVATGQPGLEDARRMGRLAGEELGVPEDLVLVGSTGVIGRRIPMDRIEEGLRGMKEELQTDPIPGARGIMTTDRVPKAFSLQVDGAVLSVVGKGAGMIAPNMATMLVYFFTDAEIPVSELDRMLRASAEETFRNLSVDTDTSTSDMVVAMASGAGPRVAIARMAEAFHLLSSRMCEAVARDGEGATKLLRARVQGAADRSEAGVVARAIVESPLVKTMVHGADPNVGRLLMAVGKCVECRVEPARVDVSLQGIAVVRKGEVVSFPEERLRELLGGDPVEIRVELGLGEGEAVALGCDLTEGYIHENTAYASS